MGVFLCDVLHTLFFSLWWENIHESCQWSSDGCRHICRGVVGVSPEAARHWATPLPVLQANPDGRTEQVQTGLAHVGELLSDVKLSRGPLSSCWDPWIPAVISCAWKTEALQAASTLISHVLNILFILTVWNLSQSIIIIIIWSTSANLNVQKHESIKSKRCFSCF